MRLLAALVLLAACGTASAQFVGTKPPPVSPTFRGCYMDSKRAWLVDAASGAKATPAEVQRAADRYLRGTPAEMERAHKYLAERRAGKHRSGDHMAAVMFSDCMTRNRGEPVTAGRALSCYREQRVLLHAMDMRLDRKMAHAETEQRLLTGVGSADEMVQLTIRRLVRDVYEVLSTGEEDAFTAAEFELCMTAPQ